jgi:uncharacterized membrane protein YuzA (DUF378 family)
MSEQTKRTLIWSLVSAIICGLIGFVQFDLVYYVPGPVFGFLFVIVNLTKPLRIAIFIATSSVIYIIAWNIFFLIGDTQLSIPSRVFGGLLAGLFGALALALLTKLLASTPIKAQDEARTIILGASAGILFIEVMFRGIEVSYFAWPLAFAVWQISVGWSLTTSVQNHLASQVAHLANPMN